MLIASGKANGPVREIAVLSHARSVAESDTAVLFLDCFFQCVVDACLPSWPRGFEVLDD